MENEPDYIVYELKKINKLPLWIFLFIILAVTCVCSYLYMQYFIEKLGSLVIPAIIILNILPVAILTYITLNYNRYDRVMISDEAQTVCFVKNNSIAKVFPYSCITKALYRGNTLYLKNNQGEEERLVLKRSGAENLFLHLEPLIIQNLDLKSKMSINEIFTIGITSIVLIIAGIVMFSVMSCDCNRTDGQCTLRSYAFLTPNVNMFNINNVQDTRLEYQHGGRYGHYELKIDINENGKVYTIDPGLYFYMPFLAKHFAYKLNEFKENNDATFSYTYITPLLWLIIFLLLWGFSGVVLPAKIMDKKLVCTSAILSFCIYYIICANFSLNFSSEQSMEKIFIGYYNQAMDFKYDKKNEDALNFLKKAESVYADDYLIALDISDIYRDKHDYENVVKYALKSIELNESNKKSLVAKNIKYADDQFDAKIEALYNAALAYRKLDDCENAVIYYTKLLDTIVIPDSYTTSRLNRGKCYLKLGKKKEALDDFTKYREIVTAGLKKNTFKYNAKNLAEVENLIASIDKNAAEKQKKEKAQSSEKLFENLEKIKVNPPSEYDNLTKEEIFNLRKKYVNSSRFASKFYKPNETVFGGIQDKKPWYGLDNTACPFGPDVADGPTARSVYMNNPSLLLGVINHLGYHYPKNTPFCQNKLMQFIPKSMYYDKDHKMIIAVYKADKSLIRNIQQPEYIVPLAFVGLNARDFGYKYAYVYEKYNLYFTKSDNVSENVYELLDYIHIGSSCKLKGGCNNTSPMQPKLEFSITDLPAGVTFKLWKHTPMYNTQGADIYFKAIFEE